MVRDAEMAFHHQQQYRDMSQDPPKKALPWWKLSRPAKALARQTSLSHDLAGSPSAPSSADRLFDRGDDVNEELRSSSSILEPWTCSKTASCSAASVSVQDTEAPSPDSRHGGHSDGGGRRRRGRQREPSRRFTHEDHDHDVFDSDFASSNCFASNSLVDTSVSSGIASSSGQQHPATTPTPFPLLLLPESGQKRPRAAAQAGAAAAAGGGPAESHEAEVSDHHRRNDQQDSDGGYPEAPSSLVSCCSDIYMDGLEEDCAWEAATGSPGTLSLSNANILSSGSVGGSGGSDGCVGRGWQRAGAAGCAAAAAVGATSDRCGGANSSGDGGVAGGSRRADGEEVVVAGDDNLLSCDEEHMGVLLEEEIDLTPAFCSNNTKAVGGGGGNVRDRMGKTEDDGGQPRVVYDVLAVDRGCGKCDTSVVPFPLEDEDLVSAEKMRAVTAGQGEFLARR